ncbi:HDOD domain-containing protein [uncultured Desulfosarcina sp.]|uniref:HDOD domain-containing protein n=1 Tax=uncultured Desulfosarcina sp. TaxID=218289 RepID=UPI0029C622B3|nr:HDOD domain-containing protein [uncultured Desulfosarcina sp.]
MPSEHEQAVLSELIEEMHSKGNLPALNETVIEISRLARKQESSTLDLATVIMRDCGLASNLLATVNSSYYAPRFPIKTITSAVTYLGFDKVYLLSLGLGLFRHSMATLQKRKLLKLYAVSYFSGILAMALSKAYCHDNPEEIFIAGLLYRLPGLALANTFPDQFQEMERLIHEKEIDVNRACRQIFKVRYDEICDAVMAFFNLPEDLEHIIHKKKAADDPLISLVGESASLAAMLFGDQAGGKNSLRKSERSIAKILDQPKFSVADLIRQTFETDANVKDFFNLSGDDVEMMVNILEWGKASPMEIVTHMDFGASIDASAPADTPDVLIGNYLTELALCRKRNGEINQLLMLAQEALFRCLPESEIFIAFLVKGPRPTLQGKFYVGTVADINARDFAVPMDQSNSAIVRSFETKAPIEWSAGSEGLGLPHAPFGRIPFKHAYLAPIVVNGQTIGLCFAGRLKESAFNERECIWIDQIVDHIAGAFEKSRE